MPDLSTTKMSSRGQVVIPEEVRARMGLETGTQFLVLGERDVVILKRLVAPSMEDFGDLVREARRQARKAGMRRPDVEEAVRDARRHP